MGVGGEEERKTQYNSRTVKVNSELHLIHIDTTIVPNQPLSQILPCSGMKEKLTII